MSTVDITGARFGRWTVLRLKGTVNKSGQLYWLCKCDCGTVRSVCGSHLRDGKSSSCGCRRNEIAAARFRTHGESKQTPEWRSWMAMMVRCHHTKNPKIVQQYEGIVVCERWHKYENFLADMGRKPTPKHHLHRKNPLKNYCLKNCEWVTQQENNARRRKWCVIERFTDEELLAEVKRRKLMSIRRQ